MLCKLCSRAWLHLLLIKGKLSITAAPHSLCQAFYVVAFGIAGLAFYYGSALGQGISGRYLIGCVWLALSLFLYRHLLALALEHASITSLP